MYGGDYFFPRSWYYLWIVVVWKCRRLVYSAHRISTRSTNHSHDMDQTKHTAHDRNVRTSSRRVQLQPSAKHKHHGGVGVVDEKCRPIDVCIYRLCWSSIVTSRFIFICVCINSRTQFGVAQYYDHRRSALCSWRFDARTHTFCARISAHATGIYWKAKKCNILRTEPMPELLRLRRFCTNFYVRSLLPESIRTTRFSKNGHLADTLTTATIPRNRLKNLFWTYALDSRLELFFSLRLSKQMKNSSPQPLQPSHNTIFKLLLSTSLIMFTATRYSTTAFVSRVVVTKSPLRLAALGAEKSMSTMAATTPTAAAGTNQAEVVLVGCGAPNRGMGWYHAVQMLDKKYVVCHVCECVCVRPWEGSCFVKMSSHTVFQSGCSIHSNTNPKRKDVHRHH